MQDSRIFQETENRRLYQDGEDHWVADPLDTRTISFLGYDTGAAGQVQY